VVYYSLLFDSSCGSSHPVCLVRFGVSPFEVGVFGRRVRLLRYYVCRINVDFRIVRLEAYCPVCGVMAICPEIYCCASLLFIFLFMVSIF